MLRRMRRVVRRRTTTTERLALELDAAVLPVRDVVTTVQDVGLQVQRVRLRPSNRPNRQDLDLTYTGETAPEALVELFEHLQNLTGVIRVTSVVATTNTATRSDGQHLRRATEVSIAVWAPGKRLLLAARRTVSSDLTRGSSRFALAATGGPCTQVEQRGT